MHKAIVFSSWDGCRTVVLHQCTNTPGLWIWH